MKNLFLSLTLLFASSGVLLASGSFQNNIHSSMRQVNYTPMGYQQGQRVAPRRQHQQQPQFYQRVQPRVQQRVQSQVQSVPRVSKERVQRRPQPQMQRHQNNRFSQAQQAAKRGNPQAEFDLAMMYAKGEGVAKDPREAFNLFHRAARKGHVDAKYCMAVNFDKGYGVIKQKELARHWYGIAAKAGHRGAKQRLAQLDNTHRSNQGMVRHASFRR